MYFEPFAILNGEHLHEQKLFYDCSQGSGRSFFSSEKYRDYQITQFGGDQSIQMVNLRGFPLIVHCLGNVMTPDILGPKDLSN